MRDFRINWAVILAIMVLLGFTYFSYMGVLYSNRVDGNLLYGGLYALGVILIVSICVVIMCVSRATRWKEIGTAGQIFFALVILAVFGFSSIPFTGFMKAIQAKEAIQAKIDHTRQVADSVDKAYNVYVEQRLSSYEEWLRSDSLRPQNAGGRTCEEKITNLKKSLENHLKPQSLVQCQDERKQWLSKIEGMSVWNIYLPKNIEVLGNSVESWVADYKKLSNISYDNTAPTLFEYEHIDNNPLKELGELNIHWVAIVAALLAFFFMLLPYIVTESFYGGRTTSKKVKKKHNDVNQPIVEEKDYE